MEQTSECDDPVRIYHKERLTFYQVRVFMLASTALLFFQLICGSFRRRTNNFFIHGGLWLGYTLLQPLTTYTLGLMQPSGVEVVIYPVWALSLFLVAGGTNSITSYDVDDSKQWKRRLFRFLQDDIYFCLILFRLLYGGGDQFLKNGLTAPVILLLIAVFIAPKIGVVASWMVNHSDPSKVIADYMKDHAKFANSRSVGESEEYFGPLSMKGCNYMVRWPYKVTRTGRARSSIYRCEVPQKGVVTVEMIWDKCSHEDTFASHGVSISRIKGACLAYSLSHLLMRRFFGMDCAEATLPETRRFVLEGLLSEQNTDKYTEAFRVIEVELAFLYDSFYTKYAVIFGMEGFFFLMVIVKIICAFALGALLLSIEGFARVNSEYSYDMPVQPGKIFVGPGHVTIIVTVTIIAAFLAVEALQSILYLGSDWAMVSLACCSATGRSDGFIPLGFRRGFGFLISRRRRPLFRYWQNKLGQYSVIEGSKFFSSRNNFAFESNRLTMFICSKVTAYLGRILCNLFSSRGFHLVRLPGMLKSQIASALKSCSGHLTNGKASLQRNEVSELFSWALQGETQAENMLIWHIATEYCRIASSDEAKGNTSHQQYREVAIKLSCYSAYLMSEAPELLPGNYVDTKFVFDHAIYEARDALGTKNQDRVELLKALADAKSRGEGTSTIFSKGIQLGTELEENIDDGPRRWKVMAEFWIETILYVAPSDNAKAHMEHLAQGGEFLTHLWALLTHAGILTRGQEPTTEEPAAVSVDQRNPHRDRMPTSQ